MKFLIYIAVLVISSSTYAESSITNRKVECEGSTVTEANGHISAPTSFHAVFSIEGDVVNMVEGDASHFSKSYKASEEITKPGRPGYLSDNGNLFFYKTSGRFMIFKFKVLRSGLQTENTSGQCKKLTPGSVFE